MKAALRCDVLSVVVHRGDVTLEFAPVLERR